MTICLAGMLFSANSFDTTDFDRSERLFALVKLLTFGLLLVVPSFLERVCVAGLMSSPPRKFCCD
jgi:hypothetical protein